MEKFHKAKIRNFPKGVSNDFNQEQEPITYR